MNYNLNAMLNLMNNVKLDGTLTIIDEHNNNEVITVKQENDLFVITFSSGSPIQATAPTFPLAMQYITNNLEETLQTWEIDQRELDDMGLLD